MISVLAITALYRGAWWAPSVLGVVWVVDMVGGAVGIAAHNRRVKALAAANPEPDEDPDAP